jgi:DNA-binding transcriptional ArsR family regulator
MTQTSNDPLSPCCPAECCERLDALLAPEFFKALGDPRRQAILFKLATAGGSWTVSQVAGALPIDISVVSRHLAQLRDAGILDARREGKEVRYAVRYDTVARLLRQLADALESCCPPPGGGACDDNEKERPNE